MKLFLYALLCFNLNVYGDMIKVAVIDTGLNNSANISVCEVIDFTGTGTHDDIGHGSNVSGLIDRYAGVGKDKYCQVILKVFAKKKTSGFELSMKALRYVMTRDDIKVINYSAGGTFYSNEERTVINSLLNQGKIFIAAAGNEGENLDDKCNFYPACYDDRVITVGNLKKPGTRNKTSNYGMYVKVWEFGTNQCANSVCLTGTSQATAVQTGKQIKALCQTKEKQ